VTVTGQPLEKGSSSSGTSSELDVFRPIQYLGSKLRALPKITETIRRIGAPGQGVLDVFAGTTVVSQALAQTGFRVLATDAMGYSATFAKAVLGVGRAEDEDRGPLLPRALAVATPATLGEGETLFATWLAREEIAVLNGDGDELIAISQAVPQIWRPKGATDRQEDRFRAIHEAAGCPAYPFATLASTHYAGTYFGIRQAVDMDEIRVAIHAAHQAGEIDAWEESVLLTALLSAASDAVSSPGKHFAQAHLARKGKDLSFLRQRIVQDRSVDIRAAFVDRVSRIMGVAASGSCGHFAARKSLEDVLSERRMLPPFHVVYADPPYTAQQYSRFYHVPEVLLNYAIPRLHVHRGQVTRGLYPEDRFKSRFSSKRSAPGAFSDLLDLAAQARAALAISYSGSHTGETGNERMIDLDTLLRLCRERTSRVELIAHEHVYRQFNHGNSAVEGRDDREFLIVCEGLC